LVGAIWLLVKWLTGLVALVPGAALTSTFVSYVTTSIASAITSGASVSSILLSSRLDLPSPIDRTWSTALVCNVAKATAPVALYLVVDHGVEFIVFDIG
jgi:hypothetical protein